MTWLISLLVLVAAVVLVVAFWRAHNSPHPTTGEVALKRAKLQRRQAAPVIRELGEKRAQNNFTKLFESALRGG